MREKLFIKFSMLLFVLGMSTNVVWGQGLAGLIEGIDPEDPSTWFYVRLNASVSNPGCGTTTPGKVYLIYTNSDDARTPQNPWIISEPKPANPYAEYGTDDWRYRQWSEEYGFTEGVNDAKNGLEKSYRDYWEEWSDNYAVKAGYDAGYDWYKSGHYLNESNPTGAPDNSSAWGSSAALKGFSLLYAPGFDDLMGYSAYAYFFGKAAENDGWYFTGWSFTEGESDLGGVVGTADSLQFRILPSATNGEANFRNEYVYATFQPVRVSDYKVNGLINTSVSNTTTVVFDAVGQRVSTADFTVSIPEANFSAAITSCENNKVTVTVTYSGTSNGEFRGNVTLASKSGCSQLTAPVYARVGADGSDEATLYDGKTPTSTSGSLLDMIAAANNTDKIVVLNKNYASNLTINAKVTINLNGYTVQDIEVAGGEVTIAYNKYGSNGQDVSVTGGKLILNGGEFTTLTVESAGIVEQNGATFIGASSNSGILNTTEGRFEAGLTTNGTLTIDGGAFEGATAITVSGGTATINKATISGDTYGIQVTGGITNITSKLVSVNGGTNAVKQSSTGTVNLTNGKFVGETAPLAGTINLQAGYFKVDGANIGISVPTGKKVLNVLAGAEFAEGYRYFVGDDASSVGVCRIGTTSYATLEEALAYANNTGATVTIIMTNDYTLPAGYYTLPATATLIVPMNNEQEVTYPIVHRVSNNSAAPTAYVEPTEFRRLTFAKGVNLDVHGLIEVTCTQRASDDAYATLPHGPYGLLVMNEGSHMTLQNGSELRVWGYMTGKGETDARRGSTVREQFQMGDWKGGSVAFSMLAAEDTRVFPITQYYIQNIESPVKYHPGSVLSTTTSVSANYGSIGMTAMANDIAVVGVSGVHTAMFLMDQEADAENTWVRKWYDAEHDVQTYDVNSGAHLGSMVLDLGKLGTQPLVMNSGYFVLPITNNMKIHLLSGMMDFTQTTSLLPGAEVEVDKESVISIVHNDDPSVFSGSLYVYDADDWGKANGKGDAGTLYTKVVPYSPSFGGKPNVRTETAKPDDAKINVHGSFDTGQGAVYTTPGGANIFSTNTDAGSFIFTTSAPASTSDVYQYINGSGYTSVAATSAKLKNGNGEYVSTETADNNQIYMYMDNEWKTSTGYEAHMVYFDCFTAQVNMLAYGADVSAKANNIAIAHAPDNIAECMAIMSGMSVDAATAQGLRSNAAIMGMVSPQIEAMREAGYDLGGAVEHIYIKPQEWVEIAGQAHIQLNIEEDRVDELEALYDAGNYADAVQGYMDYITARAYNPYLAGVDGNEDHTYSDAAGAGRLFILMEEGCQWWEAEKKDNLYHCIHPENDTYYYWLDDPDEEDPKYGEWKEKTYTITWKNWNGDIIQTMGPNEEYVNSYTVTYGTMAEFLGTNPTRTATNDYTYDFTGWSPALGPVTSDVTYTATYAQKDRMYTIIFQNEGGVEIERQFLKLNEIPACENTPTKVGHTLEWSPAIAAVTGNVTYTATWLENPPTEYEVTFFDYNGTTELKKSNVAVGAMPTPPANPSGKPATTEYSYVFDHWAPALEAVSATSIKSYTAVYREVEKTYTVIFQNENGSEIERHEYAYGATPVCSATPTKANTAEYTYGFAWTPQIQTVMGAATYRATFPATKNKYTVTVKSNPSGACSISGAGLYDYNTSATLTLSVNDGYTFTGWSDGQEGTNTTRTITVTEDKELVANFTVAEPDYTITWKSENGQTTLAEVGQKANTATIYTGAIPTKAATAAKTYTFYGWSTAANGGGTIYKNGMTPKATADATYFANFNEADRTYTITWANEAGTANIEVDYEQPYGAAIAYNSATPTKAATADYTYTFDGWSTTVGGNAVTLPATVTGDATFYAHFKQTARSLVIGVDGEETFGMATQLSNLTITSNGSQSGQLVGGNYLNITGHADFILTQTFAGSTWYCVAVPWRVDVNGGILLNGTTPAVLGKNIDICYYDGAVRAAQGKVDACWVYMRDMNTKVLEPGRAYMIALKDGASSITFRKKAQEPLLTTAVNVQQYPSATATDAGWNAIANPALYHAYINAGSTGSKAQTYIAGEDRYDWIELDDDKLIVGQPIYVQAPAAKSIVANTSGYNAAPARRAQAAQPTSFDVNITAAGAAKYADHLSISLNEDKEENVYVIGQDLVKFGVSGKVAQMWIDRYDSKLCVNTVASEGDAANFPMSIFAPKAGSYTIAIEREVNTDDQVLYLTYNGEAIWNLSEGAYVASLNKGTDNKYGLRVSARAPQITTGVDEAIVDAKGETRKVLINNQVFIIRGEKVYTIDGQMVK